MFESLDEQLKKEQAKESTPKERAMLYIAISAASVLIFGGIILAVQHLQ